MMSRWCECITSTGTPDWSVEQVMRIADADPLDRLDGLPEGNHLCTRLVARTIHGAVRSTPAYQDPRSVDGPLDGHR